MVFSRLEINDKNGLSQSKCGFLAAVGQFKQVADCFVFFFKKRSLTFRVNDGHTALILNKQLR